MAAGSVQYRGQGGMGGGLGTGITGGMSGLNRSQLMGLSHGVNPVQQQSIATFGPQAPPPQPSQAPQQAPAPSLPPPPPVRQGTPMPTPASAAPTPAPTDPVGPAMAGLQMAMGGDEMQDPGAGWVGGMASQLNPRLGQRTPPQALRILSQMAQAY